MEKIVAEHKKRKATGTRNNSDTKNQTAATKNGIDSYTLKVPYIGKPKTTFATKIALYKIVSGNIRVVYTTCKVKNQFRLKEATGFMLVTIRIRQLLNLASG